MAAAPIAVGAAIVTTAGQLPAKNVIHVPTMEEPGMKIGAENVRRAARAALIAADRNGFKVIAIPGIGTDLGDVPIDEAARAIVEEIRAHRRPYPETIYLVDTNDEMMLRSKTRCATRRRTCRTFRPLASASRGIPARVLRGSHTRLRDRSGGHLT